MWKHAKDVKVGDILLRWRTVGSTGDGITVQDFNQKPIKKIDASIGSCRLTGHNMTFYPGDCTIEWFVQAPSDIKVNPKVEASVVPKGKCDNCWSFRCPGTCRVRP